jgi:type IV pilus assembly protein PilE
MKRQRGFSLLELVIACAVVGILAAIAVPSYSAQMQKSRRSDAKAALLGAAGQMERYLTERGTYATATVGTGGVYANTSQNGFYSIALSNLTASTYTLRAIPTGVQANDACGTMTYTEQGVKGVTGALAVDSCW